MTPQLGNSVTNQTSPIYEILYMMIRKKYVFFLANNHRNQNTHLRSASTKKEIKQDKHQTDIFTSIKPFTNASISAFVHPKGNMGFDFGTK